MNYIIFGWDTNGYPDLKRSFENLIIPKKIIIMHGYEFDYSESMCGEEDGLKKFVILANTYNVPIILIIGGSSDNLPFLNLSNPIYGNLKIIHWSHYMLVSTYNGHRLRKYENITQSGLDIENIENVLLNHYDYRYIYLNNRPHHHRCLLVDKIAKYKLIDKGAVSWRETKYDGEHCNSPLTSLERGHVYKHWSPTILKLELEFDQDVLPKEYSKSWVQLISESTIDLFFITEKTSVPLFYMKPFLVGSCKKFHSELKNLGFYLYDEIFDYEFDDVEDIETRFDLIAQNIKRITEMSDNEVNDLNFKILPKLEANRHRAVELATKLSNQPTIITDIYESLLNNDKNHSISFNQMYELLEKN